MNTSFLGSLQSHLHFDLVSLIKSMIDVDSFRCNSDISNFPVLSSLLLFNRSLVHRNVDRNLETVKKVGLENFVIEVVTDNALDLKKQPHVREIVVPPQYVTNKKTLYKGNCCWLTGSFFYTASFIHQQRKLQSLRMAISVI